MSSSELIVYYSAIIEDHLNPHPFFRKRFRFWSLALCLVLTFPSSSIVNSLNTCYTTSLPSAIIFLFFFHFSCSHRLRLLFCHFLPPSPPYDRLGRFIKKCHSIMVDFRHPNTLRKLVPATVLHQLGGRRVVMMERERRKRKGRKKYRPYTEKLLLCDRHSVCMRY